MCGMNPTAVGIPADLTRASLDARAVLLPVKKGHTMATSQPLRVKARPLDPRRQHQAHHRARPAPPARQRHRQHQAQQRRQQRHYAILDTVYMRGQVIVGLYSIIHAVKIVFVVLSHRDLVHILTSRSMYHVNRLRHRLPQAHQPARPQLRPARPQP